jgi:hypothetical protein
MQSLRNNTYRENPTAFRPSSIFHPPFTQSRKLKSHYGARNRIQEPNLELSSQATNRLAGRFDNPMPTWFVAPIAGLKLPTLALRARIERFIEGQAFLRSYDSAPRSPPLPPLPSAACLSFSVFLCVAGRGGWKGEGVEPGPLQIIQYPFFRGFRMHGLQPYFFLVNRAGIGCFVYNIRQATKV